MKIIVLPNLPYTYRDHERLGVKFFIDKGYNVEVFDTHKIVLPGYKEKVKIEYWTFSKHYEISDREELLNKISQLTEWDLIFFYDVSVTALKLFKDMRANTKAKFITYVGGSIPISTEPCGFIPKCKVLFNQYIRTFFKKKLFTADYYISGSPKDEYAFPFLIDKNTQILKSHSRDYNLCIDVEGYTNTHKYCVFLDTDVIDASDYILTGEDKELNVDLYLKKIIHFFRWIEKYFKIQVIISAHPKSRIFFKKENLEGIKIVHGKSVELVKNAEFVLNEGTTAISYAIFFNTPMFFFSLKEIAFFKHTCAFAKLLNKKIIYIDNLSSTIKEEITIELDNKFVYDKYKKQYLTYTDDCTETYVLLDDFFKSIKRINDARR